MSQNQRLELRQGQGLVLTPQLQQSLKILQLSTTDLLNLINEEIEKNPLLTKADSEEDEKKEEQSENEDDRDESEKEDLTQIGQSKELHLNDDKDEMDASYENVWSEENESKGQEIDDSYVLNYASTAKTGFVDENSQL